MSDGAETRAFTAGDETFNYTLRRTGRRRTVGIIVEPDQRLTVMAPAHADATSVESILRRRLPWIRRQRRELELLPAPSAPRQWVSGETHRYLGRQYRLKVAAGQERSVRLVGPYFLVAVPRPNDRDDVRRLMEAWYRAHARTVIEARMRRLLAETTWFELDWPPSFRMKALTHRWGSTTRAGRITFNVDVVKLPIVCLDYVIAHELVHLAVPNHGPAFWRMLGRVMPEWRRWRERLARVEI